MSTSTKKLKQVRDVSKKIPGTVSKTKREQSTDRKKTEEKSATKPRISSRIQAGKKVEEEEKVRVVKPQASTRSKVSTVKKGAGAKSRPVTPPSSRVTKSQFFPSKKMYSNALQKQDSAVMSERPRTATLRKGSIVNNNVAGPEVPQVNYEDDFDSYESDFEEYNSSDSVTILTSGSTSSSESSEPQSIPKRSSSAGTDDEKKLDSGNYELPESRHRQILDNIKETIEKENANLNQNQGSLSDEGFEEGKSLQFINFLGAQKKYQHRKSLEMKRKRGEEILSMIRLDHYSFTLFELAPVPYDIFIKNFGRSNTIQVSIQTGEDNVNEEVHTEEIVHVNKWTQCPTSITKFDQEIDWGVYKCDYLGVGGDLVETPTCDISFNETRLEKFLLSAGNLILNIQADESMQVLEKSQKQTNLPFSRGVISCDCQAHEFLKKRRITDVAFNPNTNSKILTGHGCNHDDDIKNSIICLWNLSSPQEPEMFFLGFGDVSCVTFSVDNPSVIIAGLTNGTILIWDTKESLSWHKKVNESDVLMRSPTYSTSTDEGHCNKILSIYSLTNTRETGLFNEPKAAEICSLDEDGDVIIWSVIHKDPNRDQLVQNQGLAHWGSVIITINTRITLKKFYPELDDFKATDLTLSQLDSSHLYISTNYGVIIHCLASGGHTNVRKFLPDAISQANCLEMCPFSPQYVLAGFDNGNINFYSRVIERPLMMLSNKDGIGGVELIKWSHNHPLMFYTKDTTNTIHVWNLKISDMVPTHSIPFKDKVLQIKLSPVADIKNDDRDKTYMMIVTDKGVYVHLLDGEHGQQSFQDFESDKRKFFNYINRYV